MPTSSRSEGTVGAGRPVGVGGAAAARGAAVPTGAAEAGAAAPTGAAEAETAAGAVRAGGASATAGVGASLDAARAYVQAVGDDELLVGHRDGEWTGLGPILEEDIAFSSIAQDEIGHALVWYRLLGDIGAPDPDTIAFLRNAPDWRHAVLSELPRGDYAFSLVRQLLYDLSEWVRYEALARSGWPEMAAAAAKLRQEEKYHVVHGRTMVQRLAASAGSRARLQDALDHAWPHALGLWEPPDGEPELVAAAVVAPSAELEGRWLDVAAPFLEGCGLSVPAALGDEGHWASTAPPAWGGRRGRHGPDLAPLLEAMQGLYRSEPGRW